MSDYPWWARASIYQVYPRSFRDGNADGLGDLAGITDGLEYLRDLGVDALWMSPFYPSPQKDSGYDVADPRDVDPMYGTLDEFDTLVARAHELGLRVIVDIVPNHVSSEHAWFRAALASPPGSPERARFHFRDGRGDEPPTNWVSLFGGPAWTRVINADGSPGQWYLHLFDSSQPDLNWANPEVRADAVTTLRFWLDRGVDGFRIDVAHGMAKDPDFPDVADPVAITEALRFDLADGSPESESRRALVTNSAFFDRDELADIYREWRGVLDSYPGDRMAVAEAWVPPERIPHYIGPGLLHQIFGFDFLVVPWDLDAMTRSIRRVLSAAEAAGSLPTWALSNHDTPRVVSRLGGGDLGVARARALALLTHALPGSVYVYQGEELGLADADLPDSARQDPVFFRTGGEQKGRDAARVPLPWSGVTPPYGFSESDAELWLPQPSDWAASTVAAEEADPDSMLHLYRRALHLRRDLPDEPLEFLPAAPGILALRRGWCTCVVNTTDSDAELPVRGEVLVSSAGPTLVANSALWLRTSS